jgi:uncharacterized repeat protein (TIGR01451 family)
MRERMHERGAGWRRLSTLPLLALAMLLPASAQAATADLAISNSDSPDPVKEGAVLTYTINVTNLGPGTASDVTVTDELDSHIDSGSASSTQGMCDLHGKAVTCEVGTLGTSGPAQNATIIIKVTPKMAGQLTNTATVAVGSADTDPNSANNSVTQTTTVVAAGGGGGGGGGGGASCAGHAATIVGSGASETLRGTGGRDVIKARGGNDLITALQGKDIVCAGGGKDAVKGGAGNDKLKGGSGRDLLKGAGGDDRLLGGPGRDRCKGGPGHDIERSC